MANDNPDSGVTPEAGVAPGEPNVAPGEPNVAPGESGVAPGESGVAPEGSDRLESPEPGVDTDAEPIWPGRVGSAPSPWAPPGQWDPPAYGRHETGLRGAGENGAPTGPVPDGRFPGTIGAGYPGAGHPGIPSPGSQMFGPRSAEPATRRRGLAGVVAVAMVAALLGGGVGGVVGHSLADRNGGTTRVFGQPLPEIGAQAAPLGSVEAVAARVLPSVVQLRVDTPVGSGEGSGMVLSADGLLLTNNHVVEEAAAGGTVTVVFQDGSTAPGQIIGLDPSSDIAVLRAQNVSGLTPIELGDSDSVRVGQQVVAFGSPLGLGGTVTTGIISALDRAVTVGGDGGASEETVLNALQTDASINLGNSGGPLVDIQGRVVGINSAIATTGERGGSIGVGFSIPVNQARRVAEELERTGRASHAVLGVNVTDDRQLSGARIESVVPGSPAEAAGLRVGELVTRFGDQRILASDGLRAAVRSRAPGEVVEVGLADRTVQVTLAAAPG